MTHLSGTVLGEASASGEERDIATRVRIEAAP